jgi:hypothetical protein
MMHLDATLLAGGGRPARDAGDAAPGVPVSAGDGSARRTSDGDRARLAERLDERFAEVLGEHLPAAVLDVLADAGAVDMDADAGELAPELVAGLGVDTGADDAPAGTPSDDPATRPEASLWRLQAALAAAAHGLSGETAEGDVDSGDAPVDADARDGVGTGLIVEQPDAAGVVAGDGETTVADDAAPVDEAEETEQAAAQRLATTATAAAAAAAGAAAGGTAAGDGADDVDGAGPARRPGTAAAGQARGETADGGVSQSSARQAASTAAAEVTPTAAGEAEEQAPQLRAQGRESLATTASGAESSQATVRGERLGAEAPPAVAGPEATAAPRGEVGETATARPSAAATLLERVLEAAARLDKMPPPRQLTLELGEARVRLGIEDGVLRVQLIGDSQPEDRELLRAVTSELRSRGFDLGADGGRGSDRDGRGAAEQRPPGAAPGTQGRSGTDQPRAAAMPANATTDLRL